MAMRLPTRPDPARPRGLPGTPAPVLPGSPAPRCPYGAPNSVSFGDKEAEIAEILAGGACDDRVA
jgi:hypothetical protein